MKRLTAFFSLLLLSAPGLTLANEVTCESINDREAECRMDTSNGVRVERQLSDTRCVEGQNWGVNRGSIWVDSGCRAVFASNSSNYNSSSHGTSSDLPSQVTCESVNNRQTDCDMDTRGEVRLVRKLSDASCDYGRTWGTNKHSVWVSDGCRATFESDGSGPAYDNDPHYGASSGPANPGGVPNELVAACNAVDDDYGKVVSSTPLKPGHWEVILDYNKGRYVCNVGPGGDVTYFERMR